MTSRTIMQRICSVGVAGVAALVITAGSAAAANGAEVSKDVIVNDVEVEHTINNCSGAEGTFTRTFNGSVHTVTRSDGSTLFRGWIRADDATFVPDDPSQPTFTGRESVHVSMVSASSSATVSFVLHFWATGSDGSRASFKEVEHLTINAAGNTVEFEKPVVICR
jgi:copper(I)-binding protein